MKKFQITCNLSLDSVSVNIYLDCSCVLRNTFLDVPFQDDIDRRKMSEFGNLALLDESDTEDDGGASSKKIKLPGVRVGDMSQRSVKPEIRVTSLEFSPSGIIQLLHNLYTSVQLQVIFRTSLGSLHH